MAVAVLAIAPVADARGLKRADLILHGAKVWTGTGQRAVSGRAIAVRGARILEVGRDRSVLRRRRGKQTRVVNLRGAFAMPGLADQHTHILEQGGLGSLQPTWSGYDPVSSEAVRAALFGYHFAIFASGGTPESGCSSSEVTSERKDELVAIQRELAALGLTATVEAGLSDLGTLVALQELEREGRMLVRFRVRVGQGCLEQAAAMGLRTGSGGPWVKILGVKLYSDGWLGPRSAALREPYADRPYDGLAFLDLETATAQVRRARELGFNVTTHAIGDRGLDITLRAYEAAGARPADRYSVEHAQVLSDDLIGRMRALGVIASIQTSFATTDQRFAEKALGAERAARAYAWRTLDMRGVRLAGGSDYPVEQLAPLWGLQRIVTRTEFDGVPAGGWHPAERLSAARALRLITRDAAYASLESKRRGLLRRRWYADITVTRENLLALPPDCLAAATVVMTIVNGRVAFEGERANPPGDATCPSKAAPAPRG